MDQCTIYVWLRYGMRRASPKFGTVIHKITNHGINFDKSFLDISLGRDHEVGVPDPQEVIEAVSLNTIHYKKDAALAWIKTDEGQAFKDGATYCCLMSIDINFNGQSANPVIC